MAQKTRQHMRCPLCGMVRRATAFGLAIEGIGHRMQVMTVAFVGRGKGGFVWRRRPMEYAEVAILRDIATRVLDRLRLEAVVLSPGADHAPATSREHDLEAQLAHLREQLEGVKRSLSGALAPITHLRVFAPTMRTAPVERVAPVVAPIAQVLGLP